MRPPAVRRVGRSRRLPYVAAINPSLLRREQRSSGWLSPEARTVAEGRAFLVLTEDAALLQNRHTWSTKRLIWPGRIKNPSLARLSRRSAMRLEPALGAQAG